MKLVLLLVLIGLGRGCGTAEALSPGHEALLESDAHASSGLQNFTSPGGKYAVDIGKADRDDGGPDEYATPFLMALKPNRVIREVDKSFRDFRNHPENDFGCSWKSDGKMVGVVYLRRGWSDLAVLERRGDRWRRLALPKMNPNSYDKLLALHARIRVPHHDTWAITSVSFTRHTIACQLWDGVDIGGASVDAHIKYHYFRRDGRWVIHVDSISVAD